MALLALMLLSAIAIGMMFVSSTETTISSNFRSEETAYFSARAGVEEVRDRMLPSPPSPSGNFSINSYLPAYMPGAGNPWAVYVLNGKNLSGANMSMTDVTTLSSANPLADDQLCHDFYGYGGMTWAAANIRCSGVSGLPSGSAWYGNTFVQALQPVGNSNPVDYKWIRITLKANNTYAGNGSNNLYTDPSQPGTNQVCWSGSGNGAHQVVVPSGTSCASVNATPVYLVTALALTPSGARRIVQQEVAQTFIPFNLPAGLFAVGNGCGALDIEGGSQTGSFNSSTEGIPTNPPSNRVNSGGNVGANGNIFLSGSSTDVYGTLSTGMSPTVGACTPNGVTVSGNPGYGTVSSTPPYNPPVPPMPNPLPPQTRQSFAGGNLPAGMYGNVVIQGLVTLPGGTDINHPAVYTMNSLTINGGGTLLINGPVVINLAGVNQTTVVNMTGGSFQNTTYVPGNFVINYGGTNNMTLSGGAAAYGSVLAPEANITLIGGSNFYGQAIGKTIVDRGGTNFWWDVSLQTPPPANTTTFHDVALRELSY